MAVPDYQSLMLPVLMSAANGEVRIGAVIEKLADELNLSEEDRTEYLPSGRQKLFTLVAAAERSGKYAGIGWSALTDLTRSHLPAGPRKGERPMLSSRVADFQNGSKVSCLTSLI